MSKYVIKNCPALIKEAFQNNQIDGIARTTQIRKNLCFYNTSLQCENITDCLLKRIHQEITKELNCENCDNVDGLVLWNDCKNVCEHPHINIALEMLDIQEVE